MSFPQGHPMRHACDVMTTAFSQSALRGVSLAGRVLAPLALALSIGTAAFAAAPVPDEGWTILLDGGDLAKAEQAFVQKLERDPAAADAAYGLALLRQAQGEREKAIVTAVEGLKNAPSNPLSFLLQEMINQDAFFNRASTRLVTDSIPLLTSGKGMDPLVRFNLRWLAYQVAARSGDRAKRLEAKEQAGFLTGAYFSTPDTVLSRLGFTKVSPAERGRLETEKWAYFRCDGVEMRPPLYVIPQDTESNYLLLVPFSVDGERTALIYVNASKSYRISLDDKPLFTKDISKVQEDPTVLWKVRLKPGPHRLMVKVHAAGPGGGVHMALLDEGGDPLAAKFAADAAPTAVETAGFSDLGELKGAFRDAYPREDPRWQGFLGLWHAWRGDVARGRLVMEDSADAFPKGLAFNLLVARMYLFDSEDLQPKIAQSRAERAVERALEAAPDFPMAMFYKALLQGENSDGDQDLAMLRTLIEKAPSDPRWSIELAQRLQSKGWNYLARKVLEEASSYHPECESVETAWIAFFGQVPDPEGQAEAIRRLSKLRNTDPELEDYYGNTRQWVKLRQLLEEQAARYGDSDKRYEHQLARLEMKMGLWSEARARFEKLLALSPEDADTALQLARCCFLLGDKEGGEKTWSDLKRRRPQTFQVDLARMALGEPWPFQEKHLDLEQVLKEDRSAAPDDAPSSLLLDQMFTRVEADGSSLERYHGILRINNKEGVDTEGEQQFPGQVILSIRTIKPDGRILEPEQIPEKDTISLQGLEPGDMVEYEYFTLKPPSGVKKNAYVTSQVFLFQDIEKPFHRTQWYLEYPKSIPMQFEERNLPAPGKCSEPGSITKCDWEYRDMPRIAREPDTPNKLLFVPLVEAVGGITWKDIALFLKDGVTGAFQVTPELERRYKEAVGSAATPSAKLDAIVAYLLKEIDGENESSWQDPTQALMTRQGSRIPVACAFLTCAGIPFQLLIAEAVPDKVYRENLPRLGQFRFPVLEVDLPGQPPRYYTLSSPYRDPDALPWFLQGADALSVTSEEPWKITKIPLSFAPWISAKETERRELLPDGNVRLEHSGTLDPEAGESLRSAFHKMAEDQWKRAIQMSLSKRFGNADLEDYKLENMEDVNLPLRWDFSLVIHGYANPDEKGLTVPDPLPALQLAQVYASLKSRKLPLSTGGPVFVDQEITYALPQGFKVEYTPPNLELKSEFGRYRIQSSLKDGQLLIRREVEIPYQIVWPPKYPAFASFLARIDEAEAGQMVLVKE